MIGGKKVKKFLGKERGISGASKDAGLVSLAPWEAGLSPWPFLKAGAADGVLGCARAKCGNCATIGGDLGKSDQYRLCHVRYCSRGCRISHLEAWYKATYLARAPSGEWSSS